MPYLMLMPYAIIIDCCHYFRQPLMLPLPQCVACCRSLLLPLSLPRRHSPPLMLILIRCRFSFSPPAAFAFFAAAITLSLDIFATTLPLRCHADAAADASARRHAAIISLFFSHTENVLRSLAHNTMSRSQPCRRCHDAMLITPLFIFMLYAAASLRCQDCC